MWSVHTRNETISRRNTLAEEPHADPRVGRGRGPSPSWWGHARGPAEGPASRVGSRYTAATSVSAMSARSDFHNAPCTLPHSRSLTPSHPPPRRGAARCGAQDPGMSGRERERERRASARAFSRGRPPSERARVLLERSEPIGGFGSLGEEFVNAASRPRRKHRRAITTKTGSMTEQTTARDN